MDKVYVVITQYGKKIIRDHDSFAVCSICSTFEKALDHQKFFLMEAEEDGNQVYVWINEIFLNNTEQYIYNRDSKLAQQTIVSPTKPVKN